jgi:hypothetical protein
LLGAGISAFVDLTEDGAAGFTAYEGLLAGRAAAAKSRVGYHRLPIVDVTPPTLRELGRILAVIDAELAAGNPVYLHCRGGRGRTGVVAAAWLATRFGLNGDEALPQTRTPPAWQRVSADPGSAEPRRRRIRHRPAGRGRTAPPPGRGRCGWSSRFSSRPVAPPGAQNAALQWACLEPPRARSAVRS